MLPSDLRPGGGIGAGLPAGGTYILVLHVFEQPELSVGSLCMDDGLEGSG